MVTRIDEDVAVIGVACRFPGADDIESFWSNVSGGVESIARDDQGLARGRISHVEEFDASYFGIPPREAEILDPQHRLFLECAVHALEDAGQDPGVFGGDIGVYASCGVNTYRAVANLSPHSSAERFAMTLANIPDTLATRVAYRLGLHGPAMSVQTACSSSLVAVHAAVQALRHGECDIALAGGVNVAIGGSIGYEYQEGMIYAPDGHCRPFDKAAAGTIEGDGVGIVVMKLLRNAVADRDRILALVIGSAINNDGNDKVGYTAPSVSGQAAAIATAHASASVTADEIGYVEAHGTGTPLGDPIEITALTNAFRLTSDGVGGCAIGTVKGNIGHLIHAAGIAGFIKAVLCVERGLIPPLVNFTEPNPSIDFDSSPFYVPKATTEWPEPASPRIAGISSFGVGGTNAHVVIRQAPPEVPRRQPRRLRRPFVLSARSPSALLQTRLRLREFLASNPRADLRDLSYTLAARRKHQAHRWAAMASSSRELVGALEGQGDVGEDDGEVELRQWLRGGELSYDGDAAARLLRLPPYPFERTRHWADGPPAQSLPIAPIRSEGPNDWFYARRWERTRLPRPFHREDAFFDGDGRGLVIAAPSATSAGALRREISEMGVRCVAAWIDGELSDSRVFPARVDFEPAIQELGGPDAVAGVVALLPEVGQRGAAVEMMRQHSMVIGIAQALATSKTQAPIWLITVGAQPVMPAEAPNPIAGMPIAFARALAQESAAWPIRSIDFLNEEAIDGQVVLSEIADPMGDEEIAYRRGERFSAAYHPALTESAPRLRRGGCYLITGGLGEIGLTLAEHLATSWAARLVLVGRSGLAGGSTTDKNRLSLRRRAVEALRLTAEAVVVEAVDITDLAAVRRMVDDITRQFGRLDGVIHAAGVVGPDAIRLGSDIDTEFLDASFAAKCRGAQVLGEVLDDQDLDFCLLVSSLASVIGGTGYGAYASANRFLDAYGRDQRLRGHPWLVGNLDTFAGRGVNAPGVGLGRSNNSIKESELGLVFEGLLRRWADDQVLVSTIPWEERLTQTEQALEQRRSRAHAIGADKKAPMSSDATLGAAEMLQKAQAAFAAALGGVRVEPEDEFVALGGDSLIFLDVVDALQKDLGIEIPIQDAFAAQTPRLLAAVCESILRVTPAHTEMEIEGDIATIRVEA